MRCFDAEHFVQFWARGRVLQKNAFFWIHILGSGKSSQSAFMETGQNQFLFTRINVDIADSENARDIGFEAGSVHNNQQSVRVWAEDRRKPADAQPEYGE